MQQQLSRDPNPGTNSTNRRMVSSLVVGKQRLVQPWLHATNKQPREVPINNQEAGSRTEVCWFGIEIGMKPWC
jgi:hypothetical protein